MSIKEILLKANNVIVKGLQEELHDQGHQLTGKLEESIKGTVSGNRLEGFALHYQEFLNKGFPAKSASFKQFPFLVGYFKQRGYSEKDSKTYAAMTINKWMKEGMPTESSKAYSNNGSRTDFISLTEKVIDKKVNSIILGGLDNLISAEFHKTKSETI